MSAPLVTFAEAQLIGERLHDHWQKLAGEAPLARDDLGWADLVQTTLRHTRDVVASRPQPGESE